MTASSGSLLLAASSGGFAPSFIFEFFIDGERSRPQFLAALCLAVLFVLSFRPRIVMILGALTIDVVMADRLHALSENLHMQGRDVTMAGVAGLLALGTGGLFTVWAPLTAFVAGVTCATAAVFARPLNVALRSSLSVAAAAASERAVDHGNKAATFFEQARNEDQSHAMKAPVEAAMAAARVAAAAAAEASDKGNDEAAEAARKAANAASTSATQASAYMAAAIAAEKVVELKGAVDDVFEEIRNCFGQEMMTKVADAKSKVKQVVAAAAAVTKKGNDAAAEKASKAASAASESANRKLILLKLKCPKCNGEDVGVLKSEGGIDGTKCNTCDYILKPIREEPKQIEVQQLTMLAMMNGRDGFEPITSVKWHGEVGGVSRRLTFPNLLPLWELDESPKTRIELPLLDVDSLGDMEHMGGQVDTSVLDKLAIEQLTEAEARELLGSMLRRENELRLHPKVQAAYTLMEHKHGPQAELGPFAVRQNCHAKSHVDAITSAPRPSPVILPTYAATCLLTHALR